MTLTLYRPRRGWVRTLRAVLDEALCLAIVAVLMAIVAGLARIVFANPY